MKLDPRLVVPAALVAAAVAAPSTASADPAFVCPDHFEPTLVILAPDPSKDNNENFIVCHKETPGQGDPTKDDTGVIIGGLSDPDPDNWTDDL